MENKVRPDGVAGLKKHTMKPVQIAFMLFCLVAAGAFGIEDMIPLSGPGLTIAILIIFAIIWAHPISQVVSELSALMPAEGGIYVWVKEALGEFWGFCMGWWGTLSIYLCSAAYVVLIVGYAADYILPTIAGLCSIGSWEEWGTEGVGYGDVLVECLGYGWGVAFMVVAIASQAAIFNAYIAAGSRGFFVMADDYLCPKFLVKVSKKRGIPVLSILLLGLTTAIMMNFDFTVLLVIVGPLALMIYVILGIALLIIRKKYPVEGRDCWYIKGGNVKVWAYALAPMIIAVLALLVNGTEYFLLGFVSIGSGAVFYVIFKWMYGGLAKIDAEKYPVNPKTKLAKGDLQRLGVFVLAFGIYAVIGSFFLVWYEGSWGPEYYEWMYGDTFLMSDFWLMIKVGKIGGAIATVAGAVLLAIGKKTDPVK